MPDPDTGLGSDPPAITHVLVTFKLVPICRSPQFKVDHSFEVDQYSYVVTSYWAKWVMAIAVELEADLNADPTDDMLLSFCNWI